MMVYRFLLMRSKWLLFFLSISINSYAQQESDDLFALSPAELAEIPITIATGTARPAFRSAAVTTVITAKQITTMGATNLHEVLETVPGLHATLQAVNGDYTYTLRGIANKAGSEVLLMMNGTRYTVPFKGNHVIGMQIPVEAIQRIEVIRGPGSALYGADAFAGVINIITKKAKDINGTVVGVRGGSFNTESTWGQHGDHWLGWDIAASLQYNHEGVDNDRIVAVDAQTARDHQFGTQASLAPGAMQTQGERWNAHLNLERKYVNVNFWAFSAVNQGLKAGAGGALDNRGRLNNQSYLADAKFSTEDTLQDWELQAHFSYLTSTVNIDLFNFPAGSILPLNVNGEPTDNPAAVKGLGKFSTGVQSNLGIRNKAPMLQLSSLYKGFNHHLLRLMAGYRYEQVSATESRNHGVGVINGSTLSAPPTINIINGKMVNLTGTANVFLPTHHRDIWSLALQDEWLFTEDWQLTAGLRYDQYSDFGSTFNPRAALVWDVNEQLTTKLLYGQAFRAPSFLEHFQQNNQLFVGNLNLKPEKIDTFEWAVDYRPVRTLHTGLNIYYYTIHDFIGRGASSTALLTAINTKGQSGYGAEFEWDWQFYPDWNFKGNYAWQNSRDRSLKRRVSSVPGQKIYSAIAWKFLPQWQLQTQLNWVGHRSNFVNSPNNRPLKNYETVDLTLNGKNLFGFIDATASARNLFDSKGKEPSISAYPNNLPIPGQSFYFELSTHF